MAHSVLLRGLSVPVRSVRQFQVLQCCRMANNSHKRRVISTPDAPAAIGAYSQAIQLDDMLYLSGQIGLDPKTGNFVSEDVVLQTRQVLKNLGAVLAAAGTNEQNVIKSTVLLADINDFSKVNQEYGEYFGSNKPARAAFQAAALPKGAKVEIEAIAVVGTITNEN